MNMPAIACRRHFPLDKPFQDKGFTRFVPRPLRPMLTGDNPAELRPAGEPPGAVKGRGGGEYR